MRLFLALDVDEPVRAAVGGWVAALQQRLDVRASGLRVPRLDALHITLHFLGDVTASHADALLCALADPLSVPAFDATLGEVGTFPPRGSPRVVWVGLAGGREQALAVHEALATRLQAAGIAPAFEPRGYTPHLTLGRFKPTPDRGRSVLRAIGGIPPPQARWRVDHVTLYESDLSENRARYAVRATTRLP
jgi:2'-5' RNA ligase